MKTKQTNFIARHKITPDSLINRFLKHLRENCRYLRAPAKHSPDSGRIQGFSKRGDRYLEDAESMRHASKMLQFQNWILN